ncbi:MAG: ATP-binding protein [Chloroflexota bacterium]
MATISDIQELIRQGDPTTIDLLRYMNASGRLYYDTNPIQKTSTRNLNLAKVADYFERYGMDFEDESEEARGRLLINSEILSEDGEVTVAGMLVFGLNPSRWLHQSGIRFAHVNRTHIADDLIDLRSIEGTLDYQIDTGVALIKSNWPVAVKLNGTRMEDTTFSYADRVLRELLVNACVHRNYALQSQIRVFLFNDRLEFRSPGRLPNSINVEKLKVGVSHSVNPILVRFMNNLRYIERIGRGLPMVYQEATRNGKQVEFKEVGEEFWVTLER